MRLLKIGRDASCDIVLNTPRASALHAELTLLDNGDILLEDKGSRNGTYIMNRPIKPGVQVNVKRGDAIRFADVELLWSQVPLPEDNSAYRAIYGIGTNFRNEIQPSGPTVSRFHATLKIDRHGKAFLQDHRKNGTTVNGQKIMPGQAVRIRKRDSVVCGGVPVNLASYIPSPRGLIYRTLGLVAAVVVAVCCGMWIYRGTNVPPRSEQALENASVCVYGGYYFSVTLKDDPFHGTGGWPDVWEFGQDGSGRLVNRNFNVYCEGDYEQAEAYPFAYTGTAFFVSDNGELGTNRHIAIPWEYDRSEYEDQIRNFITLMCSNYAARAVAIQTSSTLDEAQARFNRVNSSDLEIGGKHVYFGIGLTGAKVDSQLDLLPAQVIAESGDANKDVALIRLNSRRTPEHILEMGAVYDLDRARVDTRALKLQDEELTIVGYPMGDVVTQQSFNGQELHPTIHTAKLSKNPDEYRMQIQTTGIGGFSGSPVSDSRHRLVGVLCSGFRNTNITYCCNIRHLKELFDKYGVRE